MAAGMIAPSGGGKRHGRRLRRRHAPIAEINVTPFVDVTLVLLIVFMVAAPLLTVGVPIDLPESRASSLDTNREPITVSVREDGAVFLQDAEVSPETLVATLQAIAQNGLNDRIFVRGDRNTNYGAIMRIMGRLNEAGYRRIALVTLEERGNR